MDMWTCEAVFASALQSQWNQSALYRICKDNILGVDDILLAYKAT